MQAHTEIDAYIASFPAAVQAALEDIRAAIRDIAPNTTEAIKYGIPTFIYRGKNLVHFGGFHQHVGFYPTPTGITEFEQVLAGYKQGKGSVQFPLNQPMPLDLVRQIVVYRLGEVDKGNR